MSTATLSQSACDEIDHWLTKYPAEHKQSALLPALTLAQKENGGYLTEALMDAVAAYLALPKITVYEAASFYSMYELKAVGKYKIEVCSNVSCKLCGAEKIINHIQQRLEVKTGETTADGKFTLREVECLAACANAPMMQIGEQYYEDLTPEKVDQILQKLGEDLE
ncbi:MAG: NADH-quinone oxidoreductase subunit NuoE [Gammaproteobacteria bacterium]